MFGFLKALKKIKRASERFPVRVMFKFHYENRDYRGLLKNISITGCGFQSSDYVKPGNEIEMEVIVQCRKLYRDLKWVSINERAQIKWINSGKDLKPGEFDVGCEFLTPPGEERKKLCGMFESLIKNRGT